MSKQDHPGLDCAHVCAAGEYTKSMLHKMELFTGLETDTSEIVNEMILSMKTLELAASLESTLCPRITSI